MAYEDAVQELHQVSLGQFVAERKRLAGELKAAGNAADAKRLLERKRPTVSAWVVNQLYWHARAAFDEMLATAEQLRKGHLKASGDHRDAIAKLRKHAASILEDAGHAPAEATLRRVTTTLAALAATGSFDPDPPGAVAADRDPPGFEAVGIVSEPDAADDDVVDRPEPEKKHDGKDDLAKARAAHKRKQDDQAEERRRAEMAEKKREEEERKRRTAARHRLEAALRTAKGDLDTRERAVKQLEKATQDLANAQEVIDELTAKLAELDAD